MVIINKLNTLFGTSVSACAAQTPPCVSLPHPSLAFLRFDPLGWAVCNTKKFLGGYVPALRLFMCPCASEEGHLGLRVSPEAWGFVLYFCITLHNCRASHTGPTKNNTAFQTVRIIPFSRVLGELKMSKNFSTRHL